MMVYHKEFIAVVKCQGRVLRERKESADSMPVVQLPFNTEYTILLKNESSRRALAKVTIDGEDVLNGNQIVVNPNSSFDLLGFLDCNGKATHAFKFIKKTQKIVDHQGDKLEHGILKVQYSFEVEKPIIRHIDTHHHHHHHHTYNYPWFRGPEISYGVSCDASTKTRSISCNVGDSLPCVDICEDEGLTAKGDNINHQYGRAGHFNVECNWKTITIKLSGVMSTGGEIVTPITTNDKIKCNLCGTLHKSSVKYCSECGNNLM